MLRPTFGADGYGGTTVVAPGDRTVLVWGQATTNAWPWATITGAVAPPGTHVVGTWVAAAPEQIPHTEIGGSLAQQNPSATWRDLVPAGDPVVDGGSPAPVRVSRGHEIGVVVWQVDDCDALRDARLDGDMWDVPFLTWRTIVGTSMTSGTSDANVPQGSAAQELLEQAGVCPAAA